METFELRSSAFENEGDIPDLYTCRGKNISPPLAFGNVPEGTVSYALIMVDLDTPVGTLTHWILYNIPAEFRELGQGIPPGRLLENGLNQGRNGMLRCGYMGPCPPWGRHRYLFRLFSLDTMLSIDGPPNKGKILRMMETHILAEAALVGYYPKKGRRDRRMREKPGRRNR
jgi:Raf kinase inhibitor-like YbhB/YbcL family protein